MLLRKQLSEAIQKHSILRINYTPGLRVIEPYMLGYNVHGHLLLRAYQLDGMSMYQKGDWKLFSVDKMDLNIEVLTPFVTFRAGYNKNDPMFTKVLAAA